MRAFRQQEFESAFADMSQISWQEHPQYYPRYRERYLAMLRQFASQVPDDGLELLEIGGGQLAYLSLRIWGKDRAWVGDIQDTCFHSLRENGIDAFVWNLAAEDPPTDQRFDVIFFSEVIEHLPVPGHIPLARLRALLRPNGILLCSTPNLYRLRNIIYLVRGQQLFDHFDLPGERGYGHVLEYSAEHLSWQLKRAGFEDFTVQLCDFTHVPNQRMDRMLSKLGAPLRKIPRYRDNLVAVAKAGARTEAATLRPEREQGA